MLPMLSEFRFPLFWNNGVKSPGILIALLHYSFLPFPYYHSTTNNTSMNNREKKEKEKWTSITRFEWLFIINLSWSTLSPYLHWLWEYGLMWHQIIQTPKNQSDNQFDYLGWQTASFPKLWKETNQPTNSHNMRFESTIPWDASK